MVQNHQAFVEQAETGDAFAGVPGADLLTKLRGKDVLLTFVESYGRSAIEDPAMASVIDPVLDDGTRRLQAVGFAARSGFLTSPVHGGGSWMAHATLRPRRRPRVPRARARWPHRHAGLVAPRSGQLINAAVHAVTSLAGRTRADIHQRIITMILDGVRPRRTADRCPCRHSPRTSSAGPCAHRHTADGLGDP